MIFTKKKLQKKHILIMINLNIFKKKILAEKNSILSFVHNSILLETPVNFSIVDSVVLNRALKEPKYKKMLDSFDALLCDSSLIIFLSNLKYKRKIIGYNGAEIFKDLVIDNSYNQLIIGTTDILFNEIQNRKVFSFIGHEVTSKEKMVSLEDFRKN